MFLTLALFLSVTLVPVLMTLSASLLSCFFTAHDPSRGSGQERRVGPRGVRSLTGRVWRFSNLTDRVGSGHPEATRPAGIDLTRESPSLIFPTSLYLPLPLSLLYFHPYVFVLILVLFSLSLCVFSYASFQFFFSSFSLVCPHERCPVFSSPGFFFVLPLSLPAMLFLLILTPCPFPYPHLCPIISFS